MILAFAFRSCQFLATNNKARNKGFAKFVALINLPVPFTSLKAVLRLSAIRSAAVWDASLNLGIALDVMRLTVTFAVDINRARLDRALVHLTPNISSLRLTIVLATHPLESGIGRATNH
jgi:hypothetical protein